MNMYAVALTAALAILPVGLAAHAQTQPKGVNVGSLTCTVAGGVGFVFGSSKDLDCILAKTDGTAEHYTGTIKKYGVDLGFTKQAMSYGWSSPPARSPRERSRAIMSVRPPVPRSAWAPAPTS